MTAAVGNAALAERRAAAVAETISRIRAIEKRQGVTRPALDAIRKELYALAARKELFSSEDFPPPTDGETSTRYLLSEDADNRFALYMNSLLPGKATNPHNHTTWASVVAVEGEELNRFYRRTDDGSVSGKATLELDREVVVKPGVGVTLMPDDIHAISVTGDRPTLHLHMYGRSLETLDDRLGFDLEGGTVAHYRSENKTVR